MHDEMLLLDCVVERKKDEDIVGSVEVRVRVGRGLERVKRGGGGGGGLSFGAHEQGSFSIKIPERVY